MPQAVTPTDAVASVGRDVASALREVLLLTRRATADDEVELAMARTLAFLQRSGPVRPSDVAAGSCLDLSTVSRQLKTLEERRYVARSLDPSDGRAHLIRLTSSGERVLARHVDARGAMFDRAMAGWGDADRAALATLLGRLADDLAPTPDHDPHHTTTTSTESAL
jgi:DNA-binding MarR family transcriptional regulator